MSFVNITTNNMSRQLRNTSTFVDNWVYIPGTAITGDWTQPMLFESLNDFINTCGDHGVEGSYTFQYVTGILSAGLPVIFRRIARQRQDEVLEPGEVVESAIKASAFISHTEVVETVETTVNDVKVSEKYGGSFGNDLSVKVRVTNNTYYLDVYYKSSLLESKKICSYTDAEVETEATEHTIADRIIKTLPKITFDRIEVEVVNTDKTTFKFETATAIKLAGGVDFPEALVKAEIPASYNAIKDKILYQPKFLTSGCYTDDDMTISKPIADAMKALSEERQDCRALVDIALGVAKDLQQGQANAVSYEQLTNTSIIPSASICAPWCFVQLGSEQVWMPGSYVYLTRVAQDIGNGGEVYTPKAGLANGQLSNIIRTEFDIGSDIIEEWQEDGKAQINPIARLQGGRYIISGNSTLLKLRDNEENAFAESSADLTVIEIRRFVYNLATEMQYQYNSNTAFENFALRTSSFLDRMKSEGAVIDYNIANISDSSEPRKLKIRLDVWLSPTIKNIEIYLNVAYGEISVVTGGEA